MNLNPVAKLSWNSALRIGRSLALLMFALLGAVRCETRFSESSPGSVTTTGLTLEQRVQSKKEIDNRLAQIKVSADQVRSLIALFRTQQNNGLAGNVYTPIDFLFDINEALAGKIPEQRNLANTQKTQVMVRNAVIRVPIESLSEECKSVQTQLRTEVTTDSQSHTYVAESGIKYLIKTCNTNGEFVPVVSATWSGQEIALGFNNINLASLFQDFVKSKVDPKGVCSTDFNPSGILNSITCQNMQVGLSKVEFSVIHSLNFSNSGDLRFGLYADIFDRESGALKHSLQIRQGRSGAPEVLSTTAGARSLAPAVAEPVVMPSEAAIPPATPTSSGPGAPPAAPVAAPPEVQITAPPTNGSAS